MKKKPRKPHRNREVVSELLRGGAYVDNPCYEQTSSRIDEGWDLFYRGPKGLSAAIEVKGSPLDLLEELCDE